jgi:glycosidase
MVVMMMGSRYDQACHARGVWVMLDVVANHMGGNVPMSQLSPFNQSEHYHRCVACPSNCQINDYTVRTHVVVVVLIR